MSCEGRAWLNNQPGVSLCTHVFRNGFGRPHPRTRVKEARPLYFVSKHKGMEATMTQKGRSTDFKKWMKQQRKPDGDPYSPDVITSYVSSLGSNADLVSEARGLLKDNLFACANPRVFDLVRRLIMLTRNFERCRKKDHGKLKAAMDAYSKYLNENF